MMTTRKSQQEQFHDALPSRSSLTTSIGAWVLRITGRSRLAAHLFYSLVSSAFIREHYATAHGRLVYSLEGSGYQGHSQYLLRRNTHRIEKGLIARPRKALFGLDYIEETVLAYARIVSTLRSHSDLVDMYELQWAGDVLDYYFQVAGDHPIVRSAREHFHRIQRPSAVEKQRLVPYIRDLSNPTPVTYGGLLQLALRRRSVRWFLPKPVPRELIDKAIAIASLSPSACNRQPFEFRIFDKPELAQQIAAIPYGTIGFSQNFPVIVVVVGKLAAFFHERDRHIIYIDGALASMSFILALETLGLSSCCINWPDVERLEKRMADMLGLAPDERPIMLIALGYPDPEGLVPRSTKKALDSLRRYNNQ